MSQLTIGAVEELSPQLRPDLSQFFTPSPVAERMVEWAGVDAGMKVLEPAAGSGRIVAPLMSAGCNVTAFEIDARFYDQLVGVAAGDPITIHVGRDFLTAPVGKADLCVQNPPYHDNLDVAFILRSLEWAPRTVALLRSVTWHGFDRWNTLWRFVKVRRVAKLIRRPDFGGEHSPKADFAVFDLHRRSRREILPAMKSTDTFLPLGQWPLDCPSIEHW